MPYVAVQQIFHGSVLAYDIGHPVPDTNVRVHGYDEQGLVREVQPGDTVEAAPPVPDGVFVNAPQRPEDDPRRDTFDPEVEAPPAAEDVDPNDTPDTTRDSEPTNPADSEQE